MTVRLRPIVPADFAPLLAGETEEADPWGFFGFRGANTRERRYAENDGLSRASTCHSPVIPGRTA